MNGLEGARLSFEGPTVYDGAMGWGRGSEIFAVIINGAKRYIRDPKERRRFYVAILPGFNDGDWDTQRDCEGLDPVFDRILREQGYIEGVSGLESSKRVHEASEEEDDE